MSTSVPTNLLAPVLEHTHLSAADKALILRAYAMAKRAHEGQMRSSGEPYIIHPVAVAAIVADLGFDADAVAAALLHDVAEDTAVTTADIAVQFGPEVAALVDGVTKLKAIPYRASAGLVKASDPHVESLKKMFLAMAEDIRVIIIKLADRLHNMRTLEYQEPAKRTTKARETMDIYAPIAARLGMGRFKGELEDLAFPHARPAEYRELMSMVRDKYADRLRYIRRAAPLVRRHLEDAAVPVLDIHARAKRHWSLYQKLQRYGMDPDKVMDLVALRIIVPDDRRCYEALGAIHANYRPLPGRIKDYIAVPKPNGYRSLHTTVFCEKGRIAEIQIRTPEMHEHAENGIAAHWAYDEGGKKRAAKAAEAELAWVNQLKQYLKDLKTTAGLAKLRLDFFKHRIYVFTPDGDIKDLPQDATPVDFAYAVHSELGHRITGARVNGRIATLNQVLQNGDVVEVIKSKNAKPSWDWLKFVRTAGSRRLIRGWFKRHDPSIAIADGKRALNRELARARTSVEKLSREEVNTVTAAYSAKSLDDVLTTVSMGDLDAADVAKRLYPDAFRAERKRTGRSAPAPSAARPGTLVIGGQAGLEHKLGRCCSPAAGTMVVGYITRSKGVTVHLTSCANIRNAEKNRLLEAAWS
ncbi:MAG TPA: RelA/SpoT family protein [Candidatus Paceibacterota bacterium]|nr:RelA/SpoT family protein [Candidatus Paceibacterota bacterium]